MACSRDKIRGDNTPMVQGVVTLGTRTDVGMKRSSNQDAFCALVGPNAPSGSDALLAVADGMGGHKAGEVASEMAIRGLIAKLSRDGVRANATDGLVPTLQRTISELNAEIHTAAARPETRGMGTTLTAAVLVGNALTIGHVGDSRAYLLRDGKLQQLTQDHSWVAEQVARGILKPEEAEVHSRRNILTRAIGVDPKIQVDGMTVEVKNGDVLLICSDGVHSLIRDDEIAKLLSSGDPKSSSGEIVDLANAKGGNDNITVVVSRIDSFNTRATSSQGVHDMTTVATGAASPSRSRSVGITAVRVLLAPLWVPPWLLYRLFRSLFRRMR